MELAGMGAVPSKIPSLLARSFASSTELQLLAYSSEDDEDI